MRSAGGDRANHMLYKVYWGLVLPDALHGLGMDATKDNKLWLHDEHKRVLGYESISGMTHEALSMFIFEVTVYHAVEHGIFVRTNKKQPIGIEHKNLHDVWHLL